MRFPAIGIFVCLLSTAPADAAILRAIGLIDTSRIDQTIKTLVEYDTRNSLSSMEQMPAGKGVEAAADWIAAQFDRISTGCGGCLEVKRDKFVADPAKGSKHNRGCAVDLSIYDLKTGKLLPMPSDFDEFSERSSPNRWRAGRHTRS